jgi:TP901 family phage tail tape measure protein
MPGEQVGSAYAKIGLDDSELDRGMNSAKGKFESFAGGLEGRAASAGATIGKAIATGVVVAGAAAVAGATKGLMAFKDLESASSSAAAKAIDVNGKSVEEIKAQYDSLQDHVIKISRELGQATVFDPTDVAAAYDALAGAGQNVAKIGKDELLPFLNLASTDMEFGLGSTTELVMGIMNSFGLSMKDSEKIADQLTKGVNGTSASLQDYAYALKQSGASASGNKMPLEEYIAIIGDLKDHYIQGEMAGEALKTGMAALGTPTKAQADALEKLGLTIDQVNPRTHDFMDIIGQLKDKGATIQDFQSIFTDSSGQILYWLGQDTDKIRELTGSITDSHGLAQSMADLIMGSDKLVGAFEQAKGSTADLCVAIGQYLEPAAVNLLNAWTALVPTLEEFGDAVGKGDWEKVGKMLTEGIKAGAKELSGLGDWVWQQISPSINALRNRIQPALEKAFAVTGAYSGLKLLVSGFGLLLPVIGSVTSALMGTQLAFVRTWAAALAPIAAVVAGVALVATGLAAIGYALEPGKFKTFNQAAVDAFTGIKSVVSDVWAELQAGDFGGVSARLKQAFQDAITFVKDLDWGGLGNDIITMMGDGALAIIKSALDLGGWIHDQIKTWISQGGPRQLGRDFSSAVVGAIESILNSDFDIWNDGIKPILGTVGEWSSIGWDIVKGIALGILDNIRPQLSSVYDRFRTFAIEVGSLFVGMATDIYNFMVDPLKEIGRQIGNLTGLKPSITVAVSESPEGKLESLVNNVKSLQGAYVYVSPYGNQNTSQAISPGEYNTNPAAYQNYKFFEGYTPGQYYTQSPGLSGSPGNLNLKGLLQSVSIKDLAANDMTIYDSTSGLVFLPSGELSTPTDTTIIGSQKSVGTGLMTGQPGTTVSETQQNKEILSAAGLPAYDLSNVFKPLQPLVDLQNLETKDREAAIKEWRDLADNTIPKSGDIFKDKITAASSKAGSDLETHSDQGGQSFENHIIKSMMPVDQATSKLTAATAELSGALTSSSQNQVQASAAAATALKLGAEVGAKFTTDAGNAVRIGLNSTGQQIAVIGQVAQQNFAQAGGKWLTDASASSAQINASVTGAQAAYSNSVAQGGLTHINSMVQGGSAILSGTSQGATQLVNGGATSANNLISGSAAARSNLESGASKIDSAAQHLLDSGQSLKSVFDATYYQLGGSSGGGGGAGYEQGAMPSEDNGDWLSCSLMGTPPVNPLYYTPPGGQTVALSNITPYNVPRATVSAGTSSGVTATVSLGSGLSSSYVKLGKYDIGGISETPQMALLNTGRPEIHLTKENVREFFGSSGGTGGAPSIHIYLDGREITNLIMKKAKVLMQGKGLSVK